MVREWMNLQHILPTNPNQFDAAYVYVRRSMRIADKRIWNLYHWPASACLSNLSTDRRSWKSGNDPHPPTERYAGPCAYYFLEYSTPAPTISTLSVIGAIHPHVQVWPACAAQAECKFHLSAEPVSTGVWDACSTNTIEAGCCSWPIE